MYYVYTQAFAELSQSLKPLVDGVEKNRQHWKELAQTAKETKNNRKNSLKSISNGSVNNNNYYNSNGNAANNNINNNNNNISNNNNNNNNSDELSNASSDSLKMSKIVGKFPLDINGVSIFAPTYIKPPQNGIINSYKAQSIVNFNSWKKKDGHEVMDQ
jgi:hypothetical protein